MFLAADPLDMDTVKAVYGKDLDGNIIEIQQLSKTHPAALERLAIQNGTAFYD